MYGSYHLSLSDVPWNFMISQTHRMGGHITWEKAYGGNYSSFWCDFCKTLPTQNTIFQTFHNHWNLDITHFCICQYDKYYSKNYTVLYMCVEVIICQSDRLPEIFMISETPTIVGTSKHIKWENECGENSSILWSEFCKTHYTQNRIFQTFQNYWNLDLLDFCMYQYDKYNSTKLCSSVYVYGSFHLSLSDVPWNFMISQTHRMGEHITWEKAYGGNYSSFWCDFCKTLPTQNTIFQTFHNHWNLDITHFCICQYDKYYSKKLYSIVYVCGSYHLSVW